MMQISTFLVILCFHFLLLTTLGNRLLDIDTVEKYLDLCTESDHTKERPSPQADLTSCRQWSQNSCCPPDTASMLANESLHGFSFNFCGNMSDECRKYFIDEYCMIKCSPSLGPWIVQLTHSKFKEAVFKVPLCEEDCNAWYGACMNDKACSINWRSGGFDWSEGINKCRDGFTCLNISEVYGSARAFCEHVWDHSYKFVHVESHGQWNSSEKYCMHIPMEGDPESERIIAHNHEVARQYATQIINRVYGPK